MMNEFNNRTISERAKKDLKYSFDAQHKNRMFINILCVALLVCIFVCFQVACLYSNRKTNAEAGKNEDQEKVNPKMQREETLRRFGVKLDEFVKLAPQTKLEPQPYLNGKTVIVDVGDGRIRDAFYYGYDLTEPEIKLVYPDKPLISSKKEIWKKNFAVKSIAEKVDDVQTVIQLKFTDTDVCRWYGVAYDYEKGTELCGVKADVAVIDNTIPAIIAEKTFVNNKLPKKVEVSKNKDLTFYVPENFYQMYPYQEIEEYLKNLQQK